MKKIFIAILLSVLTVSFAFSQAFNPKSGDTQLDADLATLNKKAKGNITEFKNDIKTRFGIAQDRVEKMMDQYKMEPADVFMAAKVGQLAKKEPEVVSESFQKNRDKGWGVIAKEMGIKPGSPEFHELKNASKGKENNGKSNAKGKGGKSNGGGPDKENKGGKGKGSEKEKATGKEKKK